MNVNDLLKMTVGLVVGLILFSSILYPVVNGASHESAYQTDYAYRATETIGDYDYTCDAEALYLNDSPIQYKKYTSDNYSIGVGSPEVSLTWREQTVMWGSSIEHGISTNTTELDIDADGSWTLTYGSGTTVTSDADSKITKGIFAKNDGELAVFNATGAIAPTFKVPAGSKVILFCNYGQCMDGSNNTWALTYRATLIDDVVTMDYAYLYNSSTVLDVSSDLVITNYGTITTDNGVTTYSGYSTGLSLTGYSMQMRCMAAAPYEYQINSEYADILSIIPIMFTVALVLGAVSVIWSRRE